MKDDFTAYCDSESEWLDGYAVFMAIRESLGGRDLHEWPRDLLHREPDGPRPRSRSTLADEIAHAPVRPVPLRSPVEPNFVTFAAERKIGIIGDAPIFVSPDSADVWANPEQFLLDADRQPTVVAGVPPDYFAADGQHWGNPIYDWDADGRERLTPGGPRGSAQLEQVDLTPARPLPRVRAGRGTSRPAEKTAKNGKWVDGPGGESVHAACTALGGLPLIAEDLGLITPDVDALASSLRPARHEGAAVRARHAEEPVLAAQLRAAQRLLHRHARQRHDQRLVGDAGREEPRLPRRRTSAGTLKTRRGT